VSVISTVDTGHEDMIVSIKSFWCWFCNFVHGINVLWGLLAWCANGLLWLSACNLLIWQVCEDLRCEKWNTNIGCRFERTRRTSMLILNDLLISYNKWWLYWQFIHLSGLANCLGSSQIWEYFSIMFLWSQSYYLERDEWTMGQVLWIC
jgi:hypothetical protein